MYTYLWNNESDFRTLSVLGSRENQQSAQERLGTGVCRFYDILANSSNVISSSTNITNVCGLIVGTLTPQTIFGVRSDKKLSHLVSNCGSYRLSFQSVTRCKSYMRSGQSEGSFFSKRVTRQIHPIVSSMELRMISTFWAHSLSESSEYMSFGYLFKTTSSNEGVNFIRPAKCDF